jgi:RNase P subunit RPR2
LKILHLDLETAPITAYVWGLWKQNISLKQIIDTSRVMCFAAKWQDERGKPSFYSEWRDGHESMIRALFELVNEADAIVTYNGKNFDLPVANREFLLYGLGKPAPHTDIDLYQVVKSNFRFASNKLDNVAQELGLGSKTQHTGFQLWVDCMNKDEKAQKLMEKYNVQDVVLLPKLYEALLPWISKHPNYALFTDDTRPTCTNCGSHKVQSRGVQHNKTQSYNRYQCASCGTWMRGRFTIVDKDKRMSVLTQVA